MYDSFPELCLSLTLCNVTPQTEWVSILKYAFPSPYILYAGPRLKSLFDAFEELSHLWCYAEDLESFETACKELVNCYALVRTTALPLARPLTLVHSMPGRTSRFCR